MTESKRWDSSEGKPVIHVSGRKFEMYYEVVVQWHDGSTNQPAILTIARPGDNMSRDEVLCRLGLAAIGAASHLKDNVTWSDVVRFVELQRAKEILAS